jgi:hypothetical protein
MQMFQDKRKSKDMETITETTMMQGNAGATSTATAAATATAAGAAESSTETTAQAVVEPAAAPNRNSGEGGKQGPPVSPKPPARGKNKYCSKSCGEHFLMICFP